MEHEHVAALLARLHRAQGELCASGDDAAVREVLTSDVVWHVPGENTIAADYRGIEEVLTYLRHRLDHTESTIRMTPFDILVSPRDHVAVRAHGTTVTDGHRHPYPDPTVVLYRITEGRIAECWLLPLTPEPFAAVWTRRSPIQTAAAVRAPTSVLWSVGRTTVGQRREIDSGSRLGNRVAVVVRWRVRGGCQSSKRLPSGRGPSRSGRSRSPRHAGRRRRQRRGAGRAWRRGAHPEVEHPRLIRAAEVLGGGGEGLDGGTEAVLSQGQVGPFVGDAELLGVPAHEVLRVPRSEEDRPDARHSLHGSSSCLLNEFYTDGPPRR